MPERAKKNGVSSKCRILRLVDRILEEFVRKSEIRCLTFVNLEDFGISHQLLDRVLAVEAGSAEDLHGLGGVPVGHVGRVSLGDRRKVGVSSALIWCVNGEDDQ